MLENTSCSSQQQTLSFYATQSALPTYVTLASHSTNQCIHGITTAKRDMKTELIAQNKAKVAYQFDLASDIINRKHSYLRGCNTLSDNIPREDLIEHKIRAMNKTKSRRDLLTLLKFYIKGVINPSRIKRSTLTHVDLTSNGVVSFLTTKSEIEDHLLQRNPLAYWASGTTPFGHSALGRLSGDTGDSPITESILDGSFSHPNLAVRAFTAQCHHLLPDIPPVKISKLTYSRAFGGLREKSSPPPSGLYYAHYMCLVSKRVGSSSNPIRVIHSRLVEMPMTHGFAPQCHQVRYDCPIFKKQSNFKLETLQLIHGFKATDNQTLKIYVA
jgi:hypothetical protein